MRKFYFVSRHQPTADQINLAAEQGISLVLFGDVDAFSWSGDDLPADCDGVVCVHPLVALTAAAKGFPVGVFENANRAPEGEKPSFQAVRLEVRG